MRRTAMSACARAPERALWRASQLEENAVSPTQMCRSVLVVGPVHAAFGGRVLRDRRSPEPQITGLADGTDRLPVDDEGATLPVVLRRGVALLSAVVASFVVLPGIAAASAADDAAEVVRTYIEQGLDGQWGRNWPLLYSASQKAVGGRDAYMQCFSERGDVAGIELRDFELDDSYREPITVAGTSTRVRAMALTVELTLAQNGREESDTTTFHSVRSGKRWTVTLTQEALDNCTNSS